MSKATAPIVLALPAVDKLSNSLRVELFIFHVTNIVFLRVHNCQLLEHVYGHFVSTQQRFFHIWFSAVRSAFSLSFPRFDTVS